MIRSAYGHYPQFLPLFTAFFKIPLLLVLHRNFLHRNFLHRNFLHRNFLHRNFLHRNFLHRNFLHRNFLHRNFLHRNFPYKNISTREFSYTGISYTGILKQSMPQLRPFPSSRIISASPTLCQKGFWPQHLHQSSRHFPSKIPHYSASDTLQPPSG